MKRLLKKFLCWFKGHAWTCKANKGIAAKIDEPFHEYAKMFCDRCGKESRFNKINKINFMEKETLSLLKSALAEIQQLRQHNQLMSARLEMFDRGMLLFSAREPAMKCCMKEDIVFRIQNEIAKNESEAVDKGKYKEI